MGFWDRKVSIDEHSRIWAEAVGHPGTIWEFLDYSFMNTAVSDILIRSPTALPLLYSREVGIFGLTLSRRMCESRENSYVTQVILAYSFMNPKDSDILIRSPTAFPY